MKHLSQQKPTAIQAEDILSVAQRGVERALASRQNMIELSAEQASDVGGGLYISSALWKPIIAGGFIGPWAKPGLPSQFGAGGFGAKTLGV